MFNLICFAMIFNQVKKVLCSRIPPIVVHTVEYVKEGCPVRSIKAVPKTVILNSVDVLSKLPHVDPHELEIAIDTGANLKQVGTNVLTKSRVTDFEVSSELSKASTKLKVKSDKETEK